MDPVKKKKLLAALWEAFQIFILSALKELIVKNALKLLLKGAAGTAIQAQIITFIATELYEELAEPLAKAVIVEAGYHYDRREGKISIKKLREATNVEDYNDAADGVLS